MAARYDRGCPALYAKCDVKPLPEASMIVGVGTDIVSIERVRRVLDRFGERFFTRVLAADECALLPDGPAASVFLAGRWAAKEACVKAMGTGFGDGIGPAHVAVGRNSLGAPVLTTTGPARERLTALGVTRCHVSISHDVNSAVAFVVLEADS